VRGQGQVRIQKSSLEVSHPTDADEKEADEVARKVVGGQSAEIHGVGGTVNKKGEVSAEAAPAFQSKLESSKSGGQSLDGSTRSEMESKMGADFSNVKIHLGSEAHHMSESISAQAFTHGSDVYFNEGRYSPQSKEGKELLAHELAHTVQQKPAGRLQLQKKDKIITITVKKGQNLYRIALEYGTTVEELQKLNKLATTDIKEGQTLKVVVETSTGQTGKQVPKATTVKQELDDIYGDLKRPRYGDYTITKADLEKSIPYTDPVSGTSYTCPVKETFFGIWVSYGIDYAYKGAHSTGKDPYGSPNAFAAAITVPSRVPLFFSIEDWNKLDIKDKVRAYDNHPYWGLSDDLKYKLYPRLNAELERRVKKFKLDNTTTLESLETSSVIINYLPVPAKYTPFGKWVRTHYRYSEPELSNAPIPPGPLKQLGDDDNAVIKWNKFSLQQKVDYFNKYPEQKSAKPGQK
jgi:LysM repeat protein